MSFFKIEKSGCCEHKGLCQVQANYYYDEKDKEYALTPVKIYPEEGYPGKVDEFGSPIDEKDYQTWEDSLPVEMINAPFRIRLIYFEPHHTEEEILFCFELARIWYQKKEYKRNIPSQWDTTKQELSQARIEQLKLTDFTSIKGFSVK